MNTTVPVSQIRIWQYTPTNQALKTPPKITDGRVWTAGGAGTMLTGLMDGAASCLQIRSAGSRLSFHFLTVSHAAPADRSSRPLPGYPPSRDVCIRTFQCSGSRTFCGGSGPADPCLWLMDPDPDSAIFVTDLQEANNFFSTFFACYFLKVHVHHFSKIKSQKEVTKPSELRFFLLFLRDRRIRIRTSD